jgi:VIT1/CCC1 family predicted Fe2+/Mn2+ transporter
MAVSDYLGRFWFSAEPMFGVIMVVCFTSLFRLNSDIPDNIVDIVLQAALACCFAWGLVDGVFYVWEGRFETNRKKKVFQDLNKGEKGEATDLIDSAIKDTYLDYLEEADRKEVMEKISMGMQREAPPSSSLKDDFTTIAITVGLVLGTGAFVLVPFYLIDDLGDALVASNIMCIMVLFILGFYRKETNNLAEKMGSGIVTALVGVIITVVTVILGG